MSALFILSNLGLGDHIICNGLVRHYAQTEDSIKIPAYHHNAPSVSFMFMDLKNVEVIGVKDEAAAILLCHAKRCLRLGFYSEGGFDPVKFDQEFYRQAQVPFESRWDQFKIPGCFTSEPPKGEYAFMHDDLLRGFAIDRSKATLPIKYPEQGQSLFSWIPTIEKAKEVHVINSSFLCLWDSIPTSKDQKLFLHKYCRNTDHPTLRKDWKILL